MKPPMRHRVLLEIPVLDENGQPKKDRYGRPVTPEQVVSKARVQRKTKVVEASDGQQHETVLEVDLPTYQKVDYQTTLTYVDALGIQTKGQVVAVEDILNLSGSKVFYRTVHIGQ
ncbi:hypothetical protein CHH91_04600 [Virgibacillus sp. 7505]|uniref:hypothetical protein n=1 Tax=Virgibacillus sp. 7505 TaxID=2022548 RepID=UPI000BA77454|nr:hypothetical protein [Virgibacillus sp. 7505]PAE17289.1 hypothetical protein CHH91_04600 [Virgibacillus sp. 7505]